jgi:hypothetical protein
MSFLPKEYKIPKSSGLYAKLEDGDNKFIILGSVVLGWSYWNTDDKCFRMETKPEKTPDDIGTDREGKQKKVQHFWAIPVYNLNTKQVQILEVTQKRLMGALQDLARDTDWGDPVLKYQITIKKSGKGTETTFQALPVPFRGDIEEIKQAYEESDVDMSNYFEAEKKDNPMKTANPYSEPSSDDIKM